MSDEELDRSNDLDESGVLTLPSMSPKSLLAHFGPGIVLMMTGIGTSHQLVAVLNMLCSGAYLLLTYSNTMGLRWLSVLRMPPERVSWTHTGPPNLNGQFGIC